MKHTTKWTILTMALTLLFSGFAVAQRDRDDDDGYYRDGDRAQAQQYGFQNGYRDGMRKGHEEGRENDPFDYQTPDWRQASRGYENWMGSRSSFQNGYRDGYRSGFQAGYENIRGRGGDYDNDRDYRGVGDREWSYGRSRYGYNSPAYNIGYQDGSRVAREDLESHKRFNSSPRGKYDDRDRGYRREYGDKHEYNEQYSAGYRDGYQSNFRRHGRW
jgi:hypothetical protein